MESIWFILFVAIISGITYPILKKYLFVSSKIINKEPTQELTSSLRITIVSAAAFFIVPFMIPTLFIIFGADAKWILANTYTEILFGITLAWPFSIYLDRKSVV